MRSSPRPTAAPPGPSLPPRGVVLVREGRHALFGTPAEVVGELHARSLHDADTDLPGYMERVSSRLVQHGKPGLPPGTLDTRARWLLQALAGLGGLSVTVPTAQA